MDTLAVYESARKQQDRWLMPAILLSAALHLLLLRLGIGSEPIASSPPPLKVQLARPAIPDERIPSQTEPLETTSPETTDPPAAQPDSPPAARTRPLANWREDLRDILKSEAPARSRFEKPPTRTQGEQWLEAEQPEALIPGLREAFGPLPRARRTCGHEKTIDLGYYQITMPVAYGCTPEEKAEQMRGRQPPP